MADVERIYLDTNIFIAAFEARTELSATLRKLLSGASPLKDARFTTSEMTLAELLVLPFRRNDADQVTLYSTMFASGSWLAVQPVSREIFIRAADVRARTPSLKLPDAVHLATASSSGCTHLLTADTGMKQRGYDLPFTILRPDEPTLTSLIESLSA
jgi:predicted nucleic acid-binding protein